MVKTIHVICRNATMLITFIVMAKIPLDIKSISAVPVITSLHPTARGWERGNLGNCASGYIPLKQGCKVVTPVTNGSVRNLDIKGGAQNETDVPKRAFAKVKHGQCGDNHKDRVSHPKALLFPNLQCHPCLAKPASKQTRFIIGFHLSPHRDRPQAFTLLEAAKELGTPAAVVSDRYSAYKVPVKSILPDTKHIRVQSFKDDISNNLIECFNKQFKAWYKTKQGFSSFASANNLISMLVFFYKTKNETIPLSREAFVHLREPFFHVYFTAP